MNVGTALLKLTVGARGNIGTKSQFIAQSRESNSFI